MINAVGCRVKSSPSGGAITKGGFQQGGLNFAPLPTPLQKDTICHWDWGEGVAGFNLVQKERAGDKIIMRRTMMTMTMARGGSKGKVLMMYFRA
jgi:hypothetical protein